MATTDWEGHPFAEPLCFVCIPDHLPDCEQPASIFAGIPLRDCTCPERRHSLRHAVKACDCEHCLASRPTTEERHQAAADDDRYTWRGSATENQYRPKEERWYTVLSKVPTLWPLEHELGERPKANARAWRAHEAHLATCPFASDADGHPDGHLGARNGHLCPDPKHQRPTCRGTHLWLEEWPRFSASLIADTPQLWDQYGSWQLEAEFRADFTYWMRRLPPFFKRLCLLLGEGKKTASGETVPYTPDELAFKLGLLDGLRRRDFRAAEQYRAATSEVRHAIKLLNGFLRRAALRESFADANKDLATLMIDLVSPSP